MIVFNKNKLVYHGRVGKRIQADCVRLTRMVYIFDSPFPVVVKIEPIKEIDSFTCLDDYNQSYIEYKLWKRYSSREESKFLCPIVDGGCFDWHDGQTYHWVVQPYLKPDKMKVVEHPRCKEFKKMMLSIGVIDFSESVNKNCMVSCGKIICYDYGILDIKSRIELCQN